MNAPMPVEAGRHRAGRPDGARQAQGRFRALASGLAPSRGAGQVAKPQLPESASRPAETGRPPAVSSKAAKPQLLGGRAAPQPAFVLHQWAWSETSLVLDLFTREQGRIAAVAKGAKRPYSQLRAVLMPFQRLLVLTSRPKSEEGADILTLRTAEYAGAGASLPSARLFSGFYLNELLLKLLARGDPHPRLFDAYAETLLALAQSEDESALRAFELMLLRETGVLPELSRNTTTQAQVQPGRGYQLRAEVGLVTAAAGEPSLSGAACLALQDALERLDLPALRAAMSGDLPALKSQLRALLHYHLGSGSLRTRQMMLELRRLVEAAPSTANPAAKPSRPSARQSAR
jgi:DNA repair protein RecO (recombination protein O)